MDAPEGLSPRGAALWQLLDERLNLTGPAGILAHEACRIADRLEGMDDVIRGKGVLQLMHFRSMLSEFDTDNRNITLKVDAVFSEARQQQGRLAHLLTTLGVEAASKKAAPAAEGGGGGTVTTVDQVKQKREQRQGGPGTDGKSTRARAAERRRPRK